MIDWLDTLSIPWEPMPPPDLDLAAIRFTTYFDFGPTVLDPRYVMLTPSPEQLLVEVNDLWYDVVEHPVALCRMADDGCPNL